MSFDEKEAKIWADQNIQEVEEIIYERSYKVNDEEDELEYLNEDEN